MEISLAALTVEMLKNHKNHILAVDPEDNFFSKIVWGKDLVVPFTGPSGEAVDVAPLKVELNSKDDSQLQKLKEMVKQAKGEADL